MRLFRQPAATFNPYDPGAPRVAPDVSTPAQATLIRVEDDIRWDVLETGVFIGVDGQILLRRQGLADRVGFTLGELRRMRGTTFTHNHPNGVGFSPDDVALAGYAQLAQLRVVTSGFRHSMHGLPALPRSDWKSMLEFEQGQLAGRLHDEIRIGYLHPKDFGRHAIHLAWVRIAAKMGFVYERSKS